jgi:hypothetical protein
MVELKEAPNVIIQIVIVALLIGVAMIFFIRMADTSVQMFDCIDVVNDSVTADNTTYQDLDFDLVCDESVVVFNSTNNFVYGTGNYTLDKTTGQIKWNTRFDNGTTLGLNYSRYNKGELSYVNLNKSSNALSNFSTWWPLIIIALALGIIIAYLLRAFMGQ